MIAVLPALVTALSNSSGLDIGSQLYGSASFWTWTLATLAVVALLACSYPAAVAAKVDPAQALQRGGRSNSKRRVMYGLVVVQFAIASFLFIATNIMHAQNERMRPLSLPAQDKVVVIDSDLNEAGLSAEVLQDELRRHASISQVSAIDMVPGDIIRYRTARALISPDADSARWRVLAPAVDYDFFHSTDIQFIAGRDFDRNIQADLSTASHAGNAVIDRAMAEEYGWKNPNDAIGKAIYVGSSSAKDAIVTPRTVIGVVENTPLVPMFFDGRASTLYSLDPDRASILIVRIANNDIAGGLRAIETTWNAMVPNIPLKRRFLDEQYEESYKMVTGMLSLFRVLALMAMMVGALGLIGIATHAMSQRRFEIGVRRTLGASVPQVLIMLLKDFGKPIVIANLVAWPAAFVVAQAYTSLFSDKTPITLGPFLLSLLVGLCTAWLAVLRHASNAARMNPATVLRHE